MKPYRFHGRLGLGPMIGRDRSNALPLGMRLCVTASGSRASSGRNGRMSSGRAASTRSMDTDRSGLGGGGASSGRQWWALQRTPGGLCTDFRPLLHPVGDCARDPEQTHHRSSPSMISIKPEACPTLRTITADEIPAAFFEPVDAKAREQALVIVNDVKADGVEGLLKYAHKLGDLPEGDRKYSVSKEELKAAYDAADPELQARAACIVHACDRDPESSTPAPSTACTCTGAPPARCRAGAQVRRDAARLRR